jgi:hypothetical protein
MKEYLKTGMIVSVFVIGVACNDNGEGTPDASVDALSASCLEARDHSDLEWIQENILQKSCVFSSCHKGPATQAAGLSLEATVIAEQTINKASKAFPDWILVKPGVPSESYLLALMDHVSEGGQFEAPLSMAGTMPWNSPLLCQEKRDAVARWISGLSE